MLLIVSESESVTNLAFGHITYGVVKFWAQSNEQFSSAYVTDTHTSMSLVPLRNDRPIKFKQYRNICYTRRRSIVFRIIVPYHSCRLPHHQMVKRSKIPMKMQNTLRLAAQINDTKTNSNGEPSESLTSEHDTCEQEQRVSIPCDKSRFICAHIINVCNFHNTNLNQLSC